MAIQTSQILPKEDTETLTKSVYDQYDKLHSVIYYNKENKVEKIVKVKVDPIGRVKESKTLKQIKVDVLKPAEAGLTSITFQGSILDAGTLPVTRVGFRYWRSVNDPGFAIGGDDAGTDTSLNSGKFEQTVTGLEKNTTYYYRAYATNEYGTNYSRIYSVTTLIDPNLVIAGTTTGTAPFTVSLSANDDEETPTSYAWNLTGGNTPQFTTQVVNYTYTTAGTYTVNLTGFYSGGVTAIRTTTVQANADDTSIVGQWASVQSADYYDNVIGAYDMRNVPNINLANGLLDFWKLDDTSGNNTLTNTGNVQFVPGKIGNCAEFNNNAKALYVLSPDITPITLKSWSFWIYPTSYNNPTGEGPQQGIIANLKAGYWIYFNSPAQKITLELYTVGNFSSVTSIPLNQWTHVAIVYDRPNVSIYINGALDNTGSAVGSLGSIPQYSNIVLAAAQPGQYPFRGNIDAVGIWNRALSGQEIQTLYNSGNGTEDLRVVNAIVGPNLEAVNTTTGEVSLLLHMDGTNGSQVFTDSSTNNLTVTPNGNVQISTSVKKYGSGSASFDGSGDSITVPNSVVLGTGNFTVECWVYPNSTTGETTIFNQGNTDSTGNFIVFIANGLLRFWANSGLRYTGNITIPINQWTHIAVTRDSNVYYFFINGVLDGTHSGTYNHSGTPFKIGDGYGGIRYFNGYIDDFRITRNIARYTTNFTPPAAALPDVYTGVDIPGTQFLGDNSYLFSNATIPVTYPHTLVFVGRVNVSGAANETVLIAAQKTKWVQTSNENVMIFGRPSQLNAYNGSDNRNMGYVPNGSEWFYVAASFLANNTVRYQIKSKTQNLNGTLPANPSKLNFNGFVGFGAGLNSATNYGYVGTVRLGMFINQEFTTEGAMTTLFESVTAGPANGLLV